MAALWTIKHFIKAEEVTVARTDNSGCSGCSASNPPSHPRKPVTHLHDLRQTDWSACL